ncbi:MAG: hypothetical protein ACLQGU_17755 [bacterium]
MNDDNEKIEKLKREIFQKKKEADLFLRVGNMDEHWACLGEIGVMEGTIQSLRNGDKPGAKVIMNKKAEATMDKEKKESRNYKRRFWGCVQKLTSILSVETAKDIGIFFEKFLPSRKKSKVYLRKEKSHERRNRKGS